MQVETRASKRKQTHESSQPAKGRTLARVPTASAYENFSPLKQDVAAALWKLFAELVSTGRQVPDNTPPKLKIIYDEMRTKAEQLDHLYTDGRGWSTTSSLESDSGTNYTEFFENRDARGRMAEAVVHFIEQKQKADLKDVPQEVESVCGSTHGSLMKNAKQYLVQTLEAKEHKSSEVGGSSVSSVTTNASTHGATKAPSLPSVHSEAPPTEPKEYAPQTTEEAQAAKDQDLRDTGVGQKK